MNTRLLGLALALALAGCGSSSDDEAGTDDTAGGEEASGHHHGEGHHGEGDGHHHGEGGDHEHGEGGGHEHAMSDELRAFHDVLAPVYHMDPGAERAQATCAATPRMGELAGTVSDDAVTAVTGLATACGEGELDEASVAGVEQSLESVHDAFHHAMEAGQE